MKNLLLATLVILTGCATSSHHVTGKLRPPVAPDMVQIYHAMPTNAVVIGMVSADSFNGIDLNQASADAIIKLQAQAGKLGANGVFIDGAQNQPLSGARINGEAIFVSP